LAVSAVRQNGRLSDPDQATAEWKKRIDGAKRDRARFEPNWLLNLAFAAGKHHLMWSRTQRKLILPDNRDRRTRERYSEDVLTQYRMTAIGLLGADDERPQLRFREEDIADRDFAADANKALAYAWDYELDAPEILLDLRTLLVDLGTAAIRCRFDPTVGPIKAEVPHHQGKPVLDPADAFELIGQGKSLAFKDIHEGRIRWELLSPFNLLTPPGVMRERDFPWEVVVRAVHLDKVKEEFGQKADDLKADDVSSINMMGASELSDVRVNDSETSTGISKLEEHVLVYSCYERPCPDYPEGRTMILAGAKLTPLSIDQSLPYQAPDGTPRTGLTYFFYWRQADRFWGRSLVDPSKDLQRRVNRRRQQQGEIIDRGLPKIFVEEGGVIDSPSGRPVEVVEIKQGTSQPVVFPGVQPGPWMAADLDSTFAALERATGIRDVSLGQNPAGVQTYSQLALLHETDATKQMPIVQRYRCGIGEVVENTIQDIRRYWGANKQIALAGEEDGLIESSIFNATKMPSFYMVEIASGGVKPRSQAADLKLVETIAQYSLNAQQALPVSWLKDSYDTGKPQPLPEPEDTVHLEKAQLENHVMLQGGAQMLQAGNGPPVADYDPIQIHIPEHRKLEVWAEMSGNAAVAALVERHIQQHLQVAQQNLAEQAQTAGAGFGVGAPGAPGAPPQQPSGFQPFGAQSPLTSPLAGVQQRSGQGAGA